MAELECITKAGRLAILARDVSKVLVDHGLPPIPRIPPRPMRGQRCLGGGGHHLGTPVGGLCLWPWSLGLGAAHFLSPLPQVVLHLFLLVYFPFLLYVNI
jgi:hypothetical protein